MPAPERSEVHFLEEDNLCESESSLTDESSRGIDHRRAQDVERLDELIGRYLPVAQCAEQGFDRALSASYIVVELIEMKSKLLESYFRGTP